MVDYTPAKIRVSPRNYGGRVKSITVKVCISNCTGTIYVTDLLLQGGLVATGWVGHPYEIKWSLDG